jgi:uncharacterized alkaline shock family protein YloU
MNHDYYYLNNYRNSGEMGISRRAIETIATLAVNQVEGAEIEKVDNKKKWNFFLNDPVRAFFRKDGRIELHLNVVIHKNINVQEICERIQEEVANAITTTSEALPFSIQIKVVQIR